MTGFSVTVVMAGEPPAFGAKRREVSGQPPGSAAPSTEFTVWPGSPEPLSLASACAAMAVARFAGWAPSAR